jgi:hypothetical protein
MVPAGVFLQELHDLTISKAFGKVNKATESSQKITPPPDSITESPEVMEIHSDWCTLFMVYLRIGGLARRQDQMQMIASMGRAIHISQ